MLQRDIKGRNVGKVAQTDLLDAGFHKHAVCKNTVTTERSKVKHNQMGEPVEALSSTLKNSSFRVLQNWAFESCGAATVIEDLLTGQSNLIYLFSSVQFSRSVMSDSLPPHVEALIDKHRTPREIPRNMGLPKLW